MKVQEAHEYRPGKREPLSRQVIAMLHAQV
jgi:hypothetical protein